MPWKNYQKDTVANVDISMSSCPMSMLIDR